jgi:hypothetical protein
MFGVQAVLVLPAGQTAWWFSQSMVKSWAANPSLALAWREVSSWFNVAALCVTRFDWTCPEPGVVELHTKWIVQGTPSDKVGAPTFASMEPAEQVDEVARHHYVIGSAVPIPGADALPAVSFEEPLEFCYHFARGAKEIRPEEDPTHLVLPYR